MTTLVLILKLPTTSTELTDNEKIDSETYRALLHSLLATSKQLQHSHETGNKVLKERKDNESPYERVIRNLRTDWETPMNYLQERGYFKNAEPKIDSGSNALSMDAYNLLNGPLLNPSTSKTFYNFPRSPSSLVSTDRTDRNCNYPSMYNDLACLDQYFGDSMTKSIKDKWNSWFNKNQSTTTTTSTSTTTTTTSPPTTSATTPYPIVNKTTEVISDLSLQDARDGLEFFKIYNDFMLARLASKLSQDAHERRMLKSVQNENPDQNALPPVNPTQAPHLPDFSTINENDIQILKELDSCLKSKKSATHVDGSIGSIAKADGAANDVRNDDNRGIYERSFDKYKFLLS